ncbi:MAG: NADH-quinone oxidoreductase subunit NuoH [bacterium]
MQQLLDNLYSQFAALRYIPPQAWYFLGLFVAGGAVIGFISVIAMFWIWAERKVSGHIQARVGPNRVGPYGLLQSVADGLKLFVKEDIVPDKSQKLLYSMAPLMVFLGAFIPFAALPFSENLVVSNMAIGIYYILAFEALEVIGIIMAGWAPMSKWSLYGGMRLAAQLLSYEVPMGLSVLSVVALTGTLNMGEIARAQEGIWTFHNGWFVWPWVCPFTTVAFFVFFTGALASAKRAPFDLPEAESELVAGFHTEYSGMRFAYFFLAEYAAMYVLSAVAAILFLGGWYGPIPLPESAGWMRMTVGLINLVCIKAFFLLFVMLWLRWTLPRIRIDQVMYMCLKVLLPVSLITLVGAATWGIIFK